PVRLALIDVNIIYYSLPIQAAIELLALADGIGRVVFSREQKRRRLHVPDERDRRALDESVELFERRAVKPLVVRRSVFRAELAGHVDHRRARHGRLETGRLRDGPGGHVAAVGPAADAEPVRIRDAAPDQPLDPGHAVVGT